MVTLNMDSKDIKTLLQPHFTDGVIDVVVEASHVSLKIVSHAFEGLNTLKRQQKVYAALNEHIASGEIHAVNMKTLTPQEASA